MNNQLFLQILKDPSTEVKPMDTSISDFIASFGTAEAMEFCFETIQHHATTYIEGVEAYHFFHEHYPYLPLAYDTKVLIGIETNDLFTMIKNTIRDLFRYIRDFIKKAWQYLKNGFKSILNLDGRLKKDTDNSYAHFENLYKSLKPAKLNKADEIFKELTIKTMCPLDQYLDLMNDFHKVTQSIQINSDAYVKNMISAIDKKRTETEDPNWLTKEDIGMLSHLGISIEESKAKYKQIFDQFEDSQFSLLGFRSLEQIKAINADYQKKVWDRFVDLERVVNNIQKQEDVLTKKEREMKDYGDVNINAITENIKHIQFQITLIVSLFGALRNVNTSIDFRRKRIIESGIRAIQKATGEE